MLKILIYSTAILALAYNCSAMDDGKPEQPPPTHSHQVVNKTSFFPCQNHPQWTPQQLPPDVSKKLTKWHPEGIQIIPPENPALQFRELYSAGFLGCMGAQEAGEMLLNPAYNNVIPAVIPFDKLEPEARKWDVRRLNQPKFSTPGLEDNVVKPIERLFGGSIPPNSTQIEQTLRPLLQILPELSNTIETKAIGTFLREILEHNAQQQQMNSFKPLKTIMYIESLGDQRPQSLTMLLKAFSKERRNEHTFTSSNIPNYTGILNFQFINDDYLEKFVPVLYNVTTEPMDSSGIHFKQNRTPKTTPDARTAFKKYQEMQRISVLLGNTEPIKTSFVWCSNNDSEVLEGTVREYMYTENPINTFLYHLMLTRNPSPQLFMTIKDELKACFSGKNPERFNMLQKHFGMS